MSAAEPEPSLREPQPGRFELQGVLNFQTARRAVEALEHALLRPQVTNGALELSLAGVQRADSAGLAVIIETLALARRLGQELRVREIPQSMLAMARISELDALLLGQDRVTQ